MANVDTHESESTISLDTAARLIMVTPRHLQRLVSEGWIPKTQRGRYTIVGTVQGYIKYRDHLDEKRVGQTADSDLRRTRQQEIQQRIDARDRQLIDIDEHDAVFEEAFGMLKSELIGLPARVSRARDMRKKVEREIDGILNRTVARFTQATQDLRATGKAPVAAAEDDA